MSILIWLLAATGAIVWAWFGLLALLLLIEAWSNRSLFTDADRIREWTPPTERKP